MREALRAAGRRLLTPSQRTALRSVVVWPPVGWARPGAGWRTLPLSRSWGAERGEIIDRHYIESFLHEHRDAIRGTVLEIGESVYTRRFGAWPDGDRVVSCDVLDPDPDHPEATVVADLAHAPQLGDDRWDCIICTQVLGVVGDVEAAVSTLARVLRPGGTLLVTLPGCSAVCRPDHDLWGDFWRFSPASAERLFTRCFDPAGVTVQGHGNVLVAAAFLQGMAREELSAAELAHADDAYPVIVSVCARAAPVHRA